MPDNSRTNCPICNGEKLPPDASAVGKKGTTVLIQGRVNAVIRPDEAYYPPFSTYCTVTIYPRNGSVKNLKFQTRRELERWDFPLDDEIQVEGCLHDVDGKYLLFDVRNVVVNPTR